MQHPSPSITIRPYREGDAPLLFDAATESIAEVFPWLPWCHPGYTIEESRTWIAHSLKAWSAREEFNFVIEDRSGRFLGGIGLNQIIESHRVANLGYWVRTSATRGGIATAAVQRITEFAFTNTDLVRLEIVVAVENVFSLRVAEKSGALREGIFHDRLFCDGRAHDAMMYAVLRSRRR